VPQNINGESVQKDSSSEELGSVGRLTSDIVLMETSGGVGRPRRFHRVYDDEKAHAHGNQNAAFNSQGRVKGTRGENERYKFAMEPTEEVYGYKLFPGGASTSRSRSERVLEAARAFSPSQD